ncbi:MAG: protein translocase subunit SecF [Actinobacteria bacterium]|nr:protein translocase subunit SecF [Actinomycetota bacterium]
MISLAAFGNQLYYGTRSIEFIKRRKIWYVFALVIVVVSLGGLFTNGLKLGIEFRGGTEFITTSQIPANEMRTDLEDLGLQQVIVQSVGTDRLSIQTEELTSVELAELTEQIAQLAAANAAEVTVRSVGPTWGADITRTALTGLVVFLILVMIFLSIYFEIRMAIAAFVALMHDLIVTIGIYALLGFEVTPATAIGVLTIMGYSLYDTVVVFDKVKENVKGVTLQTGQTYDEAANLAVNQTVFRSINTSVVAVLPVAGILFIGAYVLRASTLQDLAIALFVGITAGVYSSIFIATPVLTDLKAQEPQIKALKERVLARREAIATTGIDPYAVTKTETRAKYTSQGGPRNQPKRKPRRLR